MQLPSNEVQLQDTNIDGFASDVTADVTAAMLGIWLYCYSKIVGPFSIALYSNMGVSSRGCKPGGGGGEYIYKYTFCVKKVGKWPQSDNYINVKKQLFYRNIFL